MTAWDVVAVRYGTRALRKSEAYHGFETFGEPDGPYGMDYFFYVLRRAGETVLVDTGFGRAVGERRGRTSLVEPVDALARLGVAPQRVSQVVVTHLHYDHIGNLASFPGAELVVHERELEFWCGPEGARAEHALHVEAAEIEHLLRARDEGRVRVLTGSGPVVAGVESMCVGGHSPGQLVLMVDGRDGPVLLASDAVHYYEELERGWPFAIFVHLDVMIAGYDVVRRLEAEHGVPVVAGHDPLVMDRFPRLDGGLEDLGVRLSS
jgi:glyoxylase-like metal-dependent hydrolase (beta-lactamase superfamily II)